MKVYAIIKTPFESLEKNIKLFSSKSNRDKYFNKLISTFKNDKGYSVLYHNEKYYDVNPLGELRKYGIRQCTYYKDEIIISKKHLRKDIN